VLITHNNDLFEQSDSVYNSSLDSFLLEVIGLLLNKGKQHRELFLEYESLRRIIWDQGTQKNGFSVVF
jgi:hypothetical protein